MSLLLGFNPHESLSQETCLALIEVRRDRCNLYLCRNAKPIDKLITLLRKIVSSRQG